MDIQFINGEQVLHLIDHATRYSTGCRVRNKKHETIVQAIFLILDRYLRLFIVILCDNGGEFVIQELPGIYEKCYIILKTKATESARYNERHSEVSGEFLFVCLKLGFDINIFSS